MGALKKLVEQVKENHKKNRVEFPGEVKAIGREAMKDVRGTIMEVFFGKPEHQSEPGTPLNPTQQMVTQELKGGELDFER
ncbi:hypothetical protein P12x_005340 [Tundrisphaera lichenicola]|uniref:hypothetical protein n=1 Tax=Tundrisphaera lichenicola TaxID=2029860 RepID=UPI003EBDA425